MQSDYSIAIWLFNCWVIIQLQSVTQLVRRLLRQNTLSFTFTGISSKGIPSLFLHKSFNLFLFKPSWILNPTPRTVSSEIWQIISAGKTSRNIVLNLLMLILLCQSSIPGKLVQMETGMCAYFEQHSFIFIVAKCQGFFTEDLKLSLLVEPFFQNSTECLTLYVYSVLCN